MKHFLSTEKFVLVHFILVFFVLVFLNPKALLIRHNKKTRYLIIELDVESSWSLRITADSLIRRNVGLKWNFNWVKGSKGTIIAWPENEFGVLSDQDLFRVSELFKSDPWVVSAKPYYFDPDFKPDAKELERRDGFDSDIWYLGRNGINAYEAWELFDKVGKKPGEGILIALPDTGYLEHPELYRDDGTTQLRLDLQYNFADNDDPFDARDFCDTLCGITVAKTIKLVYVGHGTTTASLIISPPGKQTGTIGHLYTEGAAQYSEVIPIRVSSSPLLIHNDSAQKLIKGIQYAIDNGAKVISISMAGHYSDDYEFRKVLKEANKKGVIVIAAAGNTPYKMGNITFFQKVAKPASYPETIAVCGSNANERIWHDTCRGEEIDICSPAEDIRRARAGWVGLTQYINDTDKSEGTSMSTALVSSVAALWLSYHGYENLLAYYSNNPSKIPEAFRKIVKTTGHRRPQHWDTGSFGAGIIDAALVLKSPLPSV